MISLGVRKVVDTSDWDQSFVDGHGSSLTGINLERSSSGDRIISGSTTGAAALRPNWIRKEIEEQQVTNLREADVRACNESEAIPLESFPAERSSCRPVNPFLDDGHSREDCGQSRGERHQSKAYHLVDRKSGITLNCRARGSEMCLGEHEPNNISVRDLDTRGRRTLPVGEVTAWLDGLRLFDASRLRLDRAASSSPPHPLCDHDLLTNGGKSPFGEEPPVFEGLALDAEARSPSSANLRSPAIEGRLSVFDDRPVLVRTPVFEGWTPGFEGRAPAFEVRPSALEGRLPVSNGRFPFFEGLSPTPNGMTHAPIQSDSTPALDFGHADEASTAVGSVAEVPVAYSRAVSFLPAWDLERLEIVYSRLDACGFYFGRMTMDEARLRLTGYPVGTFLLRDSSDPRFLFSLSIQTRRGTTSIRVLYEGGLFRLDSDPDQSYLMPTFDCALSLIRHYVRLSAGRRLPSVDSPQTNSYVLRESTGRRDTPVLLRRPLETTPASLAHSCRKRIHHSLGKYPQNVNRLHLKPSLKDYLSLYPYDV